MVAATVISFFSAMSALASFAIGFLPRRVAVRRALSGAAVVIAVGTLGLVWVEGAVTAYAFAGLFGLGLGCALTLLPMAWADYFGRESYGAIRGVALSMQVVAQAVGPVLSGVLRDLTGTYTLSLSVFAALAGLAALAVLAARSPTPPRPAAA